ncbi:hypothetical protein BDV96DRAFT_596900 [Lophiotrema nucula]|uniref:Uncharacterized protein n=1 Tax=Lophiotrema nucula TaxID=690887 RepID=A0A6A5ZJT7_9PLEO|nr:hypothetical protein BDV96DRAFT_596900 [Lophiotrema nucula]
MPYLDYSQVRLLQTNHTTKGISTDFRKDDILDPNEVVQPGGVVNNRPQTLPLDPIPLTTLCVLVAALMGLGLYMWVRHHKRKQEKAAAAERARQKEAEDPRYPPEGRINPRDFSIQQKNAPYLSPIEEEAKDKEKTSLQSSSRQGSIQNDRLQNNEQEPQHGASRRPTRDAQPGPSRQPTIREEPKSGPEDLPQPASRQATLKDESQPSEANLRPIASEPPPAQPEVAPVEQDPENPDLPPSRANTGFVHRLLKKLTL